MGCMESHFLGINTVFTLAVNVVEISIFVVTCCFNLIHRSEYLNVFNEML